MTYPDPMPEPADRQAIAMLAGGREQVSSYSYGPDYYDTAPARFVLTHALGGALLPVLCATGRRLLRDSDPDGSLRPPMVVCVSLRTGRPPARPAGPGP